MAKKKVVYLFGAGATHAEIINVVSDPRASYREKYGLLISDVSKRVMQAARKLEWFKEKEEVFTSTKGSLNIEFLISLFENNQINDEYINKLKDLVENDIKKILTNELKQKFYLHKALFELHTLIEEQEEPLGFISLNYDDVLDMAYEEIFKSEPNYCLETKKNDSIPLLKLHGSFTWENIQVYEKRKNISIMPIGINKNYLFPPYNFIWGEAFEVLVRCDTLRIVGCSLNQGDLGLIDLLFKAHLERDKEITMEIIDFQPENSYHPIKANYGFFSGIVEPREIEGTLIGDDAILKPDVGNPFKIWLIAKTARMLDDKVSQTKYLKKCFDI